MNTQQIINAVINSGLLAVLLGALGTAIKYGKTLLDNKTAELTAKIKDQDVKNAVTTAEDCVTTVVAELAQTTVEAAKAKTADGKLTPEDAADIKATAVNKVQTLLSDDVQSTLNTLYGDGSTWLSSKIEEAVRALKTASIVATQTSSVSSASDTAASSDAAKPAAAAESTGTAA